MELISVIVPVYNVEKYFERCVQSILNQTYSELELILVDDGSTDASSKMCDEWSQKDKRVKVIHKENAGVGIARNCGLEIATGEYVTFADSDDYITENHIKNLYTALKENDAQAVIGAHTSVDKNLKSTQRPILHREGLYKDEEILEQIVIPLIGADVDFHNDVEVDASACMNLFSMKIIKENNLRFKSERYAVAEDQFFNIEYFYHTDKIVAVNEYGYCYFENTSSTSRKYNEKRFERTINYYTEMRKLIEKYSLTDKVGFRAERSFLMKIRVAIRLIALSDLKLSQKISKIRMILNHEMGSSCLAEYPIEKYILSMRMLMKMMRSKNTMGVFFITYLRESAKQNRFAVKVLKLVGIGK